MSKLEELQKLFGCESGLLDDGVKSAPFDVLGMNSNLYQAAGPVGMPEVAMAAG